MKRRTKKQIIAAMLSGSLLMGIGAPGVTTNIQAADTQQTPKKVWAVDFTKVKITDDFWAARQKQVVCAILNVGIEKVEATNGGFNNFIEATKKNQGQTAKPFEGDVYFLDSDAYKMIEAMSYGLQIESDGDAEIQKAQENITTVLDRWIPYIVGAQEDDGYLDTFFTLDRGTQSMSATTSEKNKWTDFAAHELYVDGHFYEAAVALYRANGDTRLLDVAIKNADLIVSIFGENGTKKATSGHQEIELGLLKLAAACEEAEADGASGSYQGEYGSKSKDYVAMAKRFLDLRGDTTDRDGYYSFAADNPSYRQDHAAVSEQTTAVGHVVRAMYQYIAMTDVCLLTESYTYDKALTSLWKDITETKSYVTGGMGTVGNNESFGSSYDLPVNGAYSETCGSIGSVMWNQKMNMLYGDSKYVDVMETTLYNAVIDGVNFDGNKFFYQNPITSDGTVERSAWFGCACCPPNLMRLINSLGGYLYTQDEAGVNVNLYMGNEADLTVQGTDVKLTETAEMPWSGDASFTVSTENPVDFELRLRVPSWCEDTYTVSVNGEKMDAATKNENGYLVLTRTWKFGDKVEVSFDMPIERTHQSDRVTSTKGSTAIKKGPIVYVAEAADNNFDLDLFTLSSNAELESSYKENITGGSDPYGIKGGLTITGEGQLATVKGNVAQKITLIPYYAWNNRGKGIMRTYLNEDTSKKYGLESFAKTTASYTSIWQSINSLNDQDETTFWCSWIQGSVKKNPWVQYSFDEPVILSGCSINWFADTADTRVPTGIKIEYLEDGSWKEVSKQATYNTFYASVYNNYLFDTVKTTAIRVTMNNTGTHALGINEWKLIEGNASDLVTDDTNTKNDENTAGTDNGSTDNTVTTPSTNTQTTTADSTTTTDNQTTVKKVSVAKVKKLKTKRLKKGVKLTYKKASKATGYVIYRSTSKKKGYKKITTTKKVSYVDKKAKKNKTYYYKVRAYRKQAGKKVYGAWSNIATAKKVKFA